MFKHALGNLELLLDFLSFNPVEECITLFFFFERHHYVILPMFIQHLDVNGTLPQDIPENSAHWVYPGFSEKQHEVERRVKFMKKGI